VNVLRLGVHLAGDPAVYVRTEAEFRDVARQAKTFSMNFES
jgi:KaiC/GvpD/RAD55 family RecA-like ATPase